MKNKQQTPQRNLRRFALWGDLKKERFVLRGGTLRFIFSERFVLRIINVFKFYSAKLQKIVLYTKIITKRNNVTSTLIAQR